MQFAMLRNFCWIVAFVAALGIKSTLPVRAEETVAVAPRSDARVLHANFENYRDGIVQPLNAGVRWLGDPFAGRNEGTVQITRDFGFSGNRAGHVSSSSPKQIARIRLRSRHDAPTVSGDVVMEFLFRPTKSGSAELDELVIWSAKSDQRQPIGLSLFARSSTQDDRYQIDVEHARSVRSKTRQRTAAVLRDLTSSEWIRVILHRRRDSGKVDLWAGRPGAERSVGTFADLAPAADPATVELGDTSTKTFHGSGYWDDIRIGGLLKDSAGLAPPEPPLRDVSRETAKVPTPIPVGRARQLFLDDVVIESQNGLQRRLHPVEKSQHNPLIVPDRAWEGRSVLLYGGVVRETSGRFRMWYLAWGKHVGQPSFICYAESDDGIKWNKPSLGLRDYGGSTANNIVLPGWSQTSVLFDPHDANPQQRYKALLRYNGMRGFTSPDGIHWRDRGVLIDQAYDGTTLHWDPVGQKWLAMVKIFKDGHRARGYAESRDFLNWTDTYFMSATDDRDADDDEMYAMALFHHQTLYIGLLRMYHKDRDVVDIQLAVSRNAKHWSRPDRTPFIPTGTKRTDWDYGNNAVPATPPIRVGDELWFYYSGRSTRHDEIPNDGAIGLAKLRVDGFVSLDADETGILTTRPLKLEGAKLFLNADASGGEIRAELLNRDGESLPKFTKDASTLFNGDSVQHQVQWQGNPKLPQQQEVRLRLHLKRAKIYAFWTE